MFAKVIKRQEEKIQEMIAVMQKAAALDDMYFEENLKKDRENMTKLIVENQGLRELLQISNKFGTLSLLADNADKVCVQTQTDSDLEAINTSTGSGSNNSNSVEGAKKANASRKSTSTLDASVTSPPAKISTTASSKKLSGSTTSSATNPSSLKSANTAATAGTTVSNATSPTSNSTSSKLNSPSSATTVPATSKVSTTSTSS